MSGSQIRIIIAKITDRLSMNFFNKIIKTVYENVIEDEFYQSITEQDIYAVINKTNKKPLSSNAVNSKPALNPQQDILSIIKDAAQLTPELEFRMLGSQPSPEAISSRVATLDHSLHAINTYLLSSYNKYIATINQSICGYDERDFYSTRKKSIELRECIEKLTRVLNKGKTITKLNIHIKNLKATLKLAQKVPNIQKMNLVQLKAIDLQKLEAINSQLQREYSHKLICLQHMYQYIVKVNNEQFVFIISNLKNCLEGFDQRSYQEVIKSYVVIQPTSPLEKLIITLLEEKIRAVYENDISSREGMATVGHRVLTIIINLHKLIKWHKTNAATLQQEEMEGPKQRRVSVSSNNSEEGPTTIELSDNVLIDPEQIKRGFSHTADSSLTELISDHLLIQDMDSRTLYEYLYLISRIESLCFNFTGLPLSKLRVAIEQYLIKREMGVYTKGVRELITCLEQEKSEWNRLPFNNNYRYKTVDKQLFRISRMRQQSEAKVMELSVNRMFQRGHALGVDDEDENAWELQILSLLSHEKLDRWFEQWTAPKQYLSCWTGDAIVCQSSLKLFSIFQRYIEHISYAPHTVCVSSLSHLLTLLQYNVYYIFIFFLSNNYKQIFYEEYSNTFTIEKKYTKRRLMHLYPELSHFIRDFRGKLDQAEGNGPLTKIYGMFKREVRQIIGENTQVLRAKVIATEACRYNLAYFQQILNHFSPQENKQLPLPQQQLHTKFTRLNTTLSELETLLLTQSSQKMVGLEIETIKTLFQSIKWYEPYEELREYVNKVVSIIRESYQKLKSCHRGQIPPVVLDRIFVLIWRTLLTFIVKCFLDAKQNNRRENKLNFQKLIDDLYVNFESKDRGADKDMQTAYRNFKSIFIVLLSDEWEKIKVALLSSMARFEYIYPIMMNIMENSDFMAGLGEREREGRRLEVRDAIALKLEEK